MLLKLWAYFDNQDLWFELLQPAHDLTEDESIRTFTEDEMSFNEAVRLLCEFGLVHAGPSPKQVPRSEGYGMHSCVHSWTLSVLNNMWDSDLATLALLSLAHSTSRSAKKSGLIEQRFLQHVARHQHFITNDLVYTQEISRILLHFGTIYASFGKQSDAEFMYLRASQGHESVGPGDVEFHPKLISLGKLYEFQGRFSELETMYRLVLQCCDTKTLNLHLELDILNHLGRLYTRQSKLSEASAVYARALIKCKSVNGPKHPDTIATTKRAGDFFIEYGALLETGSLCIEAESLCISQLVYYRDTFGPKHYETLNTVHKLADLYEKKGKHIVAQAICNGALQEYGDISNIERLPFDWQLGALVLLGCLFARTGRIDTARRIWTHALTVFTVIQGPSSEICRVLQERLSALPNSSTESNGDGSDSANIITAEATTPKHKRRRIS